MSRHSWSARDAEDRRIRVTDDPVGFYIEIEEFGEFAQVRLPPEAASSLSAWMLVRLGNRSPAERDEG